MGEGYYTQVLEHGYHEYAVANDIIILAPQAIRCWNTHTQTKTFISKNVPRSKDLAPILHAEKNFGNNRGP